MNRITSVVISIRVPRRLKEKCKELGINISEVARKALEQEVRNRREKLLRKAAQDVGEALAKLTPQQIVDLIREDRER